ncbi:hypothetical protein EDD18DRAFT_1140561 [Armillaria luteobubalina]|uniref:Uncharacterized protein n=1 Tax=Armillaria luteobubalina TaxID=153913 RepID=A0AA39UTD6_9AGAR|nr:hypothetical protein EDD18DRAFT_1140561 [Armillaria luteobubalina]
MDSGVLSSKETVLYNQDLLGAICEDLCSIGIQSLADGTKCAPSVSETALDRLWKHIYGLNPLLRILDVGSSGQNSEGIWTIPRDVPESVWNRFKLYAQRIRSLTLDASLVPRIIHPFTFINPLPRSLAFSFYYRAPICEKSKSPWTPTLIPTPRQRLHLSSLAHWKLTPIIILLPGRIDLACPASFFIGKNLRSLKITSHPITYSFLEELSVSKSLEHLQIVFAPGTLPRDSQDGFSSLKTLHVTGPVMSMTRILRLVVADILQSFTFIDNSFNLSYYHACEAMHDFHLELVGRFNLSLQELSLTYPYRAIASQEHWESSQAVFAPLYEMRLLKTLHYSGDLAFDQDTVETKLVRAWPSIETICFPQLAASLSCEILPVLAAECSQLASLTIPIKFPESGALPPRQVFRHGLRIFSSPGIPVENPVRVAGYLDSLFPYLAKIDGGEQWDEVERILLDACQLVRADERGRAWKRQID